MSGNVVRLIPNNALCNDADALADRVAELSDRIRSGQISGLTRVAVVLDADCVDVQCWGSQTSLAELVGVLEWAKLRIIQGDV